MGFHLLLSGKGISPVRPSSPTSTPIHQPSSLSSSASSSSSSYSTRGRVAFLESTATSALSAIPREWEFVQGQTIKPCKSPTGVMGNPLSGNRTFLEQVSNNRKEEPDMKILHQLDFNSFHYDYLMEGLEKMEDITNNSDVMRLEKEILLHIERLGALDLFRACLSRMTKALSIKSFSASPLNAEYKGNSSSSMTLQSKNIIVPSRRKMERKLKRQRSVRVSSKSCSSTFLDVASRDGGSLHNALSAKTTRQSLAKSEAEMSKWVKEVARLEKIQANLEEKVGNVGFSTWAEAAGIKKEVLQKHLYFGWHCRDKLLKSTRPLILYLARLYRGQGICLDDLLQAGNIGVLQGVERFDLTKGYRFATYIQYWIRKLMSTLVARHSRGIQIPLKLNESITKMKKARRALYNHYGRYPCDEEISIYTGISLSNVRLARKCSRVPVSLDQKVGEVTSVKFMEIVPDTSVSTPEEIALRHNMIKEIHEILGGLNQRERQVLALRYGLIYGKCESLEEIGKVYKVSKEWIRRIEKVALTKIKTAEIQSRLSPFQRL